MERERGRKRQRVRDVETEKKDENKREILFKKTEQKRDRGKEIEKETFRNREEKEICRERKRDEK
jgi:hypothetical protein